VDCIQNKKNKMLFNYSVKLLKTTKKMELLLMFPLTSSVSFFRLGLLLLVRDYHCLKATRALNGS